MSRYYASDVIQPFPTQHVDATKPIDDRLVAGTVDDIMSAEFWKQGTDNTLYVYNGIIVSVVNDSGNNGVYWLVNKSKYNKQSWDPEGEDGNGNSNYDINGWRRIDKVYMDTDLNNESTYPGQFGGTGTIEDPYYLKVINGGEIS